MTDQVTDIKFGSTYFVHTDQMSGLKSDNRKDPSARPGRPGPTHFSYCQIRNRTFDLYVQNILAQI